MFINRNYLIIYKKGTKHNEIQEKAWRIQAGMFTEQSYTTTDALLPILPACHQPLLQARVFVT
jgi:hypothetical protein